MRVLLLALLAAISYAQTEQDFNSFRDAAEGMVNTNGEERSPFVSVMCSSQDQSTCYGLASGPNAEEGNVCGWSPMDNKCGFVAIDEEGPEMDACMYRRQKSQCAGFSSMAEPEYVCAWDPYRDMCRGGQLQKMEAPEPGSQTIHGVDVSSIFSEGIEQKQIAGTQSCMQNGNDPNKCYYPCTWVGSNPGVCIHPNLFGGELKSTHKQKSENSSNETKKLLLLSSFGFIVGISLTCLLSKMRLKQLSEPLV